MFFGLPLPGTEKLTGGLFFMRLNTLKRNERLKSEKSISELFENGVSLFIYPVRIVYQLRSVPVDSQLKIGFSVSKKSFKRAVDRNLLKRRMREAFRLNKQQLLQACSPEKRGIDVMFLYQGKGIEDYQTICDSMQSLLQKLSLKILPGE